MLKRIFKSVIFCFLGLLVFAFSQCLVSCSDNKMEAKDKLKSEVSVAAYGLRGKEDSLRLFLEQSIDDGNELGKLFAYRLLGNYQRENARFTEAISSHQFEFEVALALNDTVEIIQALNNLGTDFRRVGALTEASDYHYRALDFAEAFSGVNTPTGMKNRVVSLNGIGNVSLSLGYLGEAKEYFNDALEDEKKLESAIGQAINYANIGAIYEMTEQYDSAWFYYERSMEQNKIAKSDMGIGLCYIHFGNIHKKKEKYEEAKIEYRKAYDLMENISDRWHWLEACISIAEINCLMDNMREYKEYSELAEKVANEIKSPEHLADIYQLKHRYELKQNNHQLALENYKKSILMQDSVQGVKRSSQYLDLRVSYERNKYNRSLQQIQETNKAEREKRRVMLFVMLFTTVAGIIIIALLYYAYRQRTRSNNILREIERTRSEFFTGITHEFRTPLTVILGLAERIDGDKYSDEAGSIIRQGTILLDMVNQLLDMARIKSRQDKSKWVNGDLVAFVEMCVDSFKVYATGRGTDLVFDSEDRSLMVDFIPNYMERIIINLLSNALRFTPRGGRISISVKYKLKKVVISVADNGSGIDPEDLPYIFQEFYIGKSEEYHSGGSGIGLALVQRMIETMNGEVEAQNIEEGGAQFVLTMPVKQRFNVTEQWGGGLTSDIVTPLTVTDYDSEVVETIMDKPEGVEGRDVSSILVVEDNADIQSYIGSLLEDRYQIRYASDGRDGMNKAAEFMPDLIITDLMMPIMDGVGLVQEIRQNQILNHIPIVVITAKTSAEAKQEAFEAGVDAYLHKPFNAKELQLRVEKLLEQRQLLREKFSSAMIEGSPDEVELSNDDREFLNLIISIVYEHIADEGLNVDFIAERVHMSRSQLNRKIKQITGYSIAAFVLHVRLEKARRMLRTDNTRVGDIAMACGFDDSSYFSRVFKQVYKMSPTQYRKTPDKNI